MKDHFGTGLMGIITAILIWVMILALGPEVMAEKAASVPEKSRDNTWLGTAGLSGPDRPADKDQPWSGNYVYFGIYDGRPIRFRVLAKDSTAYTSGKALFLDSDVSLFEECFDNAEPYSNSWSGSTLRKTLNSGFLDGFNVCEREAIAVSTGSGGITYEAGSMETGVCGAPVSINDKVFLLDPAEVRNEAYGYSADDGRDDRGSFHPVLNRKKAGSPRTGGCWYLRTAAWENSEMRGWHLLAVVNDGGFYTRPSSDSGVYRGSGPIGVSPALNIGQDHILFTSLTGNGENEFKLTLLDGGLSVTVPDGGNVSIDGATVTIPCEAGGPDADPATRVSALILDKAYLPGDPNNAGILLYTALEGPSCEGGTFDLPAGCDPDGWGIDYHVYLLAENLNGPCRTDYASSPLPLNAPGSTPASGGIQELPEDHSLPATLEKDIKNTGLGTTRISDPVPGSGPDLPWSGSYVYFGTYDGRPIRFRVLAKDATAYTSAKALFLDSDESLFVDHFDHTGPYSGIWEESDIRSVLNGPFLEGFKAPERAAIALSTGDGGISRPEDSPEARTYGVPVAVNDRVFLLDVSDVTNEAYGYAPDRGWNIWVIPKYSVPNRVKGGMFNYWWLRSSSSVEAGCVGDVNCGGILNFIGAEYYMGVAPALNIDQDAILFATNIGSGKDEFKLTLIDRDLTISVPENEKATAAGAAVTIPFRIGGSDAGETTRASVLILDNEYIPGSADKAGIIWYGALDITAGTGGTFLLPEDCALDGWGTDYRVYILAENINGAFETDHASIPVPVDAPER